MNREHLRKVESRTYGMCYFHKFVRGNKRLLAVLELQNGTVKLSEHLDITFVS